MSTCHIRKQLCYVGNTSLHLNTQVKQLLAWIVHGWETTREILVLLAWARILMLLKGEWTVHIWATHWKL